jgi:protein-tyrosine-phosphatase
MAEAFFNQLARGWGMATSAGTRPATILNPTVIKVMREVGIDLRRQKPKPLTLEMMEGIDRVITMGCSVAETCPASFVPTEDWGLADPEGKPIEEVRRIRDKIRARVEALTSELS